MGYGGGGERGAVLGWEGGGGGVRVIRGEMEREFNFKFDAPLSYLLYTLTHSLARTHPRKLARAHTRTT